MKKRYVLLAILLIVTLGSTTTSYADTDRYIIYTWGSSGETVKQIQQKLKLWGYYNGNVSGIYDYDTFDAVKAYQKDNSIEQTGITDEAVLKVMGINNVFDSGSGSLNKENEIWIMASLIEAVAKDEVYHCKVAIGAVIINRVSDPSFPSTISAVIYQPNEFSDLTEPSISSIEAARDAYNGFDPSNGAVYFWEKGKEKDKTISTLPVTKIIGGKYFGNR